MAKLKIAGAWSGILEVELEAWTVSMLKSEVAKRSDCSINLIFAGKLLKEDDDDRKLNEVGFKNNAKVLATRSIASDHKEKFVIEEERSKEESSIEQERSSRLSRLKAAATSLSKRHAEDGAYTVENFNLELENQRGEKVDWGSETDKRAIMMGLMFHTNAKQLMTAHNYKDALEVLVMGEEAFSLCESDFIEKIDNVAILQIDMVWCYFMLRDISWLSEAGERLSKARMGLLKSHGKDSSRFRQLEGQFSPEQALNVRMELLEGVVAFHTGQFEKSKRFLKSAQAKYMKLQVPDEALSQLMSMGYSERKSKRALRMSNQNVEAAVEFIVQEAARIQHQHEDNIRHERELLEQKQYGKTTFGKAVDLQKLNDLESIGFERVLAAEALRRNENDNQKALDDLTNPETNSTIQVDIETRKRKRADQRKTIAIEALVAMGFPKELVVAALNNLGTKEEALAYLLEQQDNAALEPNPQLEINTNNAEIKIEEEGTSSVPQMEQSIKTKSEERDIEMEREITDTVGNIGGSFDDYDIELSIEGEAINEYLSLLISTQHN